MQLIRDMDARLAALVEPLRLPLLAAAVAVTLGYMLYKLWVGPGADFVDAEVFWVAGRLWNDGANPYDVEVLRVGMVSLLERESPSVWGYMPHFHAIAGPMALMDVDTATAAFTALNLALLTAAALLIGAAADETGRGRILLVPAAVALAYLMMSTPAIEMVFLGQSRGLMLFAIALFAYGALRDRPVAVAAALVIVTTKPDIGLVFVAYCLADRRFWPALLAGGVASLILAAWPLLQTGPLAIAASIVDSLGTYAGTEANSAWYMNGVRHLAWQATGGGDIGKTGPVLLASALAFAASRLAATRAADRDAALRAGVALATLLALNFASIHFNSLILLTVLLIAWRTGTGALLALAALALTFRFVVVVRLAGIDAITLGDRVFVSLLLVAVLAATAALFAVALRAPAAAGPRGRRP
ncbi:MAG: glycosyltransferase 87 family protein [Pseudomonadota bacterium]